MVGSMYSFAGKRGLVPDGVNPARGIEKYAEDGRERFLSTDELVRLGAAIRKAETEGIAWDVDEAKPTSKHVPKRKRRTVIGPHAAAAIRLLLFTGCRLREILHLKWDHVDFERGLLFLPESKTGKKTVVLNAPALTLLKGLDRVGQYVVAGDDPDEPRADLKRPWAMVTREARPRWPAHSRPAPFVRQLRRGRWSGTADRRQAAWPCQRGHHRALCPP